VEAEKRSPESWIGSKLRAIIEIGEYPLVNQWLIERGFAQQFEFCNPKLALLRPEPWHPEPSN